MKCHVPVDLLQVQPRIWGDLETGQAVCLFAAGVLALAALAGQLPPAGAVLMAAPFGGYALLEVDGQPLRRIAPRLWRHVAWRRPPTVDLDLTLWQDAVRDVPLHQMQAVLHCLVGRMRRGR